MIKITGIRGPDRWASERRAPFTSASHSNVAESEKRPWRRYAQIYHICPPELISAPTLMVVQNGGTARLTQLDPGLGA